MTHVPTPATEQEPPPRACLAARSSRSIAPRPSLDSMIVKELIDRLNLAIPAKLNNPVFSENSAKSLETVFATWL
jgi:hypothetical protein